MVLALLARLSRNAQLIHRKSIDNYKKSTSYAECHLLSYVQGQEPEPKIREYFYYVDHQGMLFLDDARMKNFTSCFKDKKFLKFFFDRIKINVTKRYREFPYVSLCGRERNFIRCDDFPFVYTKPIEVANNDGVRETYLSYAHADELLTVKFEPDKIYMCGTSGRVYHPAPERVGGVGLVRSKLAIEISKNFGFENGESEGPTHYTWKSVVHELQSDWYYDNIKRFNSVIKN